MSLLFSKEIPQKQRLQRFQNILLFSLASFYALICTPVYILSVTNILISDSVFPVLWDFVQDITQLLYYWVAFSFVIYITSKYSFAECKKTALVYAGCSAGRYLVSLLVGYLLLGATDGWDSIGSDLIYMAVDILVDWLQMAVVLLVVYLFLARTRTPGVLDFRSMIAFEHPVLRCTLVVAFVPAFFRILARIRYDIFFGAPQVGTGDLFWMIFYYCSDVLSGVVGYLCLFLILSQINLNVEEEKQRELSTISSDTL